MIAFKVQVNNKNICTAGIDGNGVLTAILSMVQRESGNDDQLSFSIGGLRSSQRDYPDWKCPQVQVGDEIKIQIVETAKVKKPTVLKVFDPADDDRYHKKHIQKMAKKFGWTIVKNRSKKQK